MSNFRCDGCGKEIRSIYYGADTSEYAIHICSKDCGIDLWEKHVKSSGQRILPKSGERERLTLGERKEIVRMWKDGITYLEISEKFACSQTTVGVVIKEWKEKNNV